MKAFMIMSEIILWEMYTYYPSYRYDINKDPLFLQFILNSVCEALKDIHKRYSDVIDVLEGCGLDYAIGRNTLFNYPNMNVSIQIFLPTYTDVPVKTLLR